MTLTGASDASDVSVYRAGTIPEEILSGALLSKAAPDAEAGFRAL